MIDLGISKLALIGAVALVVIGPEKLPRVARTVGALLGKAQRYVADVKAEVNRSMELEELKKMKDSVETAARDVQSSVESGASDFEKSWSDATAGLDNEPLREPTEADAMNAIGQGVYPVYRHPKKNFRLKQKAVPQWFKARTGVRTRTQSGAARVARFRPRPSSKP
ncbi:MAG: Sec-independent protein translocase TatB [Hydrogenophaga sp. SCN 70-13]|jgi:sec-independent protein translocase protein TatB|uniref:Sec-independent protein translocase protein TatB n=1 Tax=Hydrogenophaga borbori TaxID=2294117 RepID=A0A372ELN4_9BURK|nr:MULTISPECIES: Sec-independent protein translocase protein TatB [Hydrogenophaga]NCT96782.1 Sec-independent protein translocase subunit TatB [Comamonadaceae bacterium]ODT34173.1 MAG: Sec-independent protein translocase TatB [Hydrogenophaga sp. SCN 70-13]MBN9372178.1 Sec-independent protein translocase subunit TatB [Hydrogenophaga sp.]OJV46573.1 MAG: Sec-independent protein translocase TatB [Hydrogenophaga sp. 70-12]RFP80316.1 Sec-independent protein translocase subunit TatB [Hydrogenophaga bo